GLPFEPGQPVEMLVVSQTAGPATAGSEGFARARHILFTPPAHLDFPSFQALPDPEGRNPPAAVLYRCLAGVLCPFAFPHNPARASACARRHLTGVYRPFASQKFT